MGDGGKHPRVLAVEWLAAAQDMREGLTTSPLLEEARHLLRERVPHYTQDRFFAPDIENATELLAARHLTRLLPAVLRPELITVVLCTRVGDVIPGRPIAYLSSYKNGTPVYATTTQTASAARAECPTFVLLRSVPLSAPGCSDSASAIKAAGPAVLLAYLIGGAAVFMVMRALGEMAVRNPVSGSFGSYARQYLGPLAGFITGWTYTFEMVIVALADVTAFGIYMGLWYPDVPRWIWILSIIFFIGAMNLCNVRVFGEMEFWLSLIKVVAIIAMMAAGAGIIFFGFGHSFPATGLENLWSHGGFAPNGWQGIIASLGIVMFAFGGVEIIGVTAAEAQNPKKVIPQAINTIPLRIILFYVCTGGADGDLPVE